MKKITLPLVFILSIITIWYFSIKFKSTAEHNVGHYLSSLSDNELVKIGLYAFGEDVEVYAQDAITPELEHRKSGYVERKRRPYQGNVVRIA